MPTGIRLRVSLHCQAYLQAGLVADGEAAELREDSAEEGMATLMAVYEQELKRPIRNLVNGQLARSLLIQARDFPFLSSPFSRASPCLHVSTAPYSTKFPNMADLSDFAYCSSAGLLVAVAVSFWDCLLQVRDLLSGSPVSPRCTERDRKGHCM